MWLDSLDPLATASRRRPKPPLFPANRFRRCRCKIKYIITSSGMSRSKKSIAGQMKDIGNSIRDDKIL
jgi:hypothetical protein